MEQLLQAYHGIATLIFGTGSLVVAGRLLLLSRRTGHKPELFLGCGIGGAVLGYGLMIASLEMRGGDLMAVGNTLEATLSGAGQVVHNLGLSMTLLFVLNVFRPNERWAKQLFVGLMLALWGGCAVGAVNGGFGVPRIGSVDWAIQYSVIWVYPLWTAAECFRYHGKMRLRLALGLAEPVVVNRFCLWGVASLLTAVTTWIASIPFALYRSPAALEAWTPSINLATATVGLVTIACYALTFFPPKRYAAWLRRDGEAVAQS